MTPMTQVLRDTVDALGSIMLPAALTEQIGMPIELCRRQLIECAIALEEKEKEAGARAGKNDGEAAECLTETKTET